MKKLLTLVVVLGMASIANAALTLDVNGAPNPGTITLSPTEYVWISIDSTTGGTVQDQYNAQIMIFDNATGYPDYAGAVAHWTNYFPPYGGVIVHSPPAIPTAYAFAPYPFLAYAVNSYPNPASIPTAGIGFEFELHCNTPFTSATILLTDNRDGSTDSLLLNQIPEPATMALLGLGGLALIRRRRR